MPCKPLWKHTRGQSIKEGTLDGKQTLCVPSPDKHKPAQLLRRSQKGLHGTTSTTKQSTMEESCSVAAPLLVGLWIGQARFTLWNSLHFQA